MVPPHVVRERGAELVGARARPVAPVEELDLERAEEPLRPGVVPAAPAPRHRARDAPPRAEPLPARGPVGLAPVGVDGRRGARRQAVQVGRERAVAQRRVRVAREPPGGRQPVEAVDDRREVELGPAGRELGDVGHGERPGRLGGEVVVGRVGLARRPASLGPLPGGVGRAPVGLAGVGAVPAPPRAGGLEPLLAHHAPDPLLRDALAAQAQRRVDAAVAVAAAPLLERLSDGAPERRIAVAPEPRPLVLIGAPRDPQESGDLSEGQACLPPQSLTEPGLPPVRHRSRGAAFPF